MWTFITHLLVHIHQERKIAPKIAAKIASINLKGYNCKQWAVGRIWNINFFINVIFILLSQEKVDNFMEIKVPTSNMKVSTSSLTPSFVIFPWSYSSSKRSKNARIRRLLEEYIAVASGESPFVSWCSFRCSIRSLITFNKNTMFGFTSWYNKCVELLTFLNDNYWSAINILTLQTV